MSHTRTCPDCGEEFRPEIVRCSDCGAELVDRYEGAEAPETARPDDVRPETLEDYFPVFTCSGSEELREAAACLSAARLPFKATGNAASFHLLVRSGDYAAAAQALGGRDGAVVLSPASPAGEGQDGAACPACQTRLATGQAECPECGLFLGETALACRSCRAALTPGDGQCQACGAPTGE